MIGMHRDSLQPCGWCKASTVSQCRWPDADGTMQRALAEPTQLCQCLPVSLPARDEFANLQDACATAVHGFSMNVGRGFTSDPIDIEIKFTTPAARKLHALPSLCDETKKTHSVRVHRVAVDNSVLVAAPVRKSCGLSTSLACCQHHPDRVRY